MAQAICDKAARRDIPLRLIRTSSRGLVFLEPLVESVVDGVCQGFGPYDLADVACLFDTPALHPKAIGPVDDHPWMRVQTRLTFARCGIIDPLSRDDCRAHGGLKGLGHALDMSSAEIVQEGTDSGLRWLSDRHQVEDHRRGPDRPHADRGDPFTLIEGLDKKHEIESIVVVKAGRSLDVQVRVNALAAARRQRMACLVDCGLCGIDNIEQAQRDLAPLPPGGPALTLAQILAANAAPIVSRPIPTPATSRPRQGSPISPDKLIRMANQSPPSWKPNLMTKASWAGAQIRRPAEA